jgi:hypothetical protein
MSVCCERCLLSGRGLFYALITRPEESYRLWCVAMCDPETSRMRRPWPALGWAAAPGGGLAYQTIDLPTKYQLPNSDCLLVVTERSIRISNSRHAVILQSTCPLLKWHFFPRSFVIHHFRTGKQLSQVSLPLLKYMGPPCFFSDCGVAFNGVPFIPNHVTVGHLFSSINRKTLKHAST